MQDFIWGRDVISVRQGKVLPLDSRCFRTLGETLGIRCCFIVFIRQTARDGTCGAPDDRLYFAGRIMRVKKHDSSTCRDSSTAVKHLRFEHCASSVCRSSVRGRSAKVSSERAAESPANQAPALEFRGGHLGFRVGAP